MTTNIWFTIVCLTRRCFFLKVTFEVKLNCVISAPLELHFYSF